MRSIDFSSYIAPNQPGTDYTPALTQALNDAAAQGAKEMYLGKGQIYFYTSIPPIRGLKLVGHSASQTILNIKHANNGLYFDGGNNQMSGGAEDIGIMAAGSGNSNAGIYLQGVQGASPDFADFKNVIVTALPGSHWNYGMVIDGVARTSPQGVRDLYFAHIELFAAQYSALLVRNAVGIAFDSLGCFPAGGSSGDVWIDNGSTLIFMDKTTVQGNFTVTGGSTNVYQNGVPRQ